MFQIYLRMKYMTLNIFFILPFYIAFLPLLLNKSLSEHQKYSVSDTDTNVIKKFQKPATTGVQKWKDLHRHKSTHSNEKNTFFFPQNKPAPSHRLLNI